MMASVPIARIRTMVRRPGSSAAAAYTGMRRGAPVTPAICTMNVAIFILMLLDGRGTSAPETLAAWGANIGPRITSPTAFLCGAQAAWRAR